MRTIWTIVGIVMLAGCSLESTVDPPVQYQWHGEFDEGELEGNAGLVWTEGRGRFAAGISIVGDEPLTLRPWHVHRGTCEDRGPIVGDSGEYPVLVVDQGGAGQAEALIDDSLSPNWEYFIDIHLSEQEMSTIVACTATLLQ